MKANELRIGNWVKWKDNDKVWHELRGAYMPITVDNILFFDEDEEKANLLFEPIVLTEDILLKCKPGYSVHVVGELDVMPYHNGDGTLSLKLGTLGHAYPYEIKYLHHWQNFYYVMEGKELEVNL